MGSGEGDRGSSMDTVGEGSSSVVDGMMSHGGGVHKRSWECGCEL